MKQDEQTFNDEQANALRQTRLRWLLALLINLPIPFIALPIAGSDWIEQQPGGQAANAMLLAILIGVGAVLGGLFTRNQIYKSHWRGEAIAPAGYLRANTAFFIALTLGALGVFLLSVLGGYPAPTFAAAPIVIGLLVFNFPNGAPMRPAPPRIDLDGDLS